MQRNRVLDVLELSCDLIVFFDDDYVPERRCLEKIVDLFTLLPNVAGASGLLLRDGAQSAGISKEDALNLIEISENNSPVLEQMHVDSVGLYGCNMAFRRTAIGGIRFDENLPLYGWQEDVDFAMRVRRNGRIVNTDSFKGVHRGVKKSKTSGYKFGYSQIANPLYLIKKGTMPISHGLKLIAKNLLANHIRLLRPESWIDRRGRVRGNWLAAWDLVRFKLSPRKILNL
ncbi:glycosyltransferase family 2 protein [Methylobacterium pseudosasicola]|uniref:glycosyltransferase family 2 protein n=1 Tax=Methylobacterium pseudosasicola TaxID=582667 RepID=UPI001FCDC524|nr:glycosyltransferase family 2 protein [Methylobacterium pseudosasicola]